MSDTVLVAEKTGQAVEVLTESDTDLWLTFCRETADVAEPCLPFLLDFDVVWSTAILVSKEGGSRRMPRGDLLRDIDPDEIAVNYSRDDNTTDGMTHGVYRWLSDLLDGIAYEGSLTSAETVVSEVSSVESPTERERIERAVETEWGYLGQEEMVLVTEVGTEWLTELQETFWPVVCRETRFRID